MQIRLQNISRHKGLTIIETLVAVTILMIAIAGPLVVASKGLFSATISKNQLIASYLGSESMEAVKNIRDNNMDVDGETNWLNGSFGDLTACRNSQPCDVSILDGSGGIPSIIPCASGSPKVCSLYYDGNRYSHVASASFSPFARRFYIHDPTNNGDCINDEECAVTVDVYWYESSTLYSIRLTSEITSNIR